MSAVKKSLCLIVFFLIGLSVGFGEHPLDWTDDIELINNGKDIIPSMSKLMGPCVIRVPDWVPVSERPDPKANYYLYFGKHSGKYIHMHWAEEITDSTVWQEFNLGGNYGGFSRLGVLDGRPLDFNHVTFPDVHVDHENQRFIMYFHGDFNKKHLNFISSSPYGLNFNHVRTTGGVPGYGMVMVDDGNDNQPVIAGYRYSRNFTVHDRLYHIGKMGVFARAPLDDPDTEKYEPWYNDVFEQTWPTKAKESNTIITQFTKTEIGTHPNAPVPGKVPNDFNGRLNHVDGKIIDGDKMEVFFWCKRTKKFGDLYRLVIDMSSPDWEDWNILRDENGDAIFDTVLTRAEVNLSSDTSIGDSFLFTDKDGTRYIFYAWGDNGEGHMSAVRLIPRGGGTDDTEPPLPNASTWSQLPAAISGTSITMTATTGTDIHGPVEYQFDCITAGGHDSGWQTSPSYTDSGLAPDTTYTYRVRMRDALDNKGGWSDEQSATTKEGGATDVIDGIVSSWDLSGVPTVEDAERGTVMDFDGTAGVNAESADDINLQAATHKSWSAWFKADDVNTRQAIYEQGGKIRGANIYVDAGEVILGIWGMTGAANAYFGEPISAGTWHHAVLILDGGTIKAYLDGTLINSAAAGEIAAHSGGIGIGYVNGKTKFADGTATLATKFSGLIDDLRVYNRALTEEEVTRIFQFK